MGAMRSLVAALGFLGCAVGGGCSKPAAAALRPDVLVLEVGGDYESLRRALVAAGVPVAPVVEPGPQPGVDPATEVAPPPAPPTEPAPVVADHIVVPLGRGETLIHLAKKHLGDGNRFREILAANGWSERDARRLPEGQPVKIPIDRGRAGDGR